MRFICHKAVRGKVGQRGRCAVVATLASFSSVDLQKLLLSEKGERNADEMAALRFDVYQRMNAAPEFLEDLKKANEVLGSTGDDSAAQACLQVAAKRRTACLEKERDMLLQQAASAVVKDNLHRSALLHLAGEVQSLIEDVDDLAGLESDKAFSQIGDEEDYESEEDDGSYKELTNKQFIME